MRYFYQKPEFYTPIYGELYKCNHEVYSYCTLFKDEHRGLAVIQQRFNRAQKTTKWGSIDPWIANDLYLSKGFQEYFDKNAGVSINGLYPTVTVRQIMWALKMKPLKKEKWETVFDHKFV